MKLFATVLLSLALSAFSFATSPMPPPPLAVSLQEFRRDILPSFRQFVKELHLRVPPTKDERRTTLFDGIDACLGNFPSDITTLEQAIASPQASEAIFEAAENLSVDLTDFRRSVDELVVEATQTKILRLDEAFLHDLREFWRNERHYGLWFADARRNLIYAARTNIPRKAP